jgi:ribonuclease P protein component, eubacterial
LRRLKTRSEFLRAARGKRVGRPSFGLQAVPNAADDAAVGFTVTKKTGTATERNRIKRRLRAAVTACARDFPAGHDYVLIGRREALAEPFAEMVGNLRRALKRVEEPRHKPHQSPAGAGDDRNP